MSRHVFFFKLSNTERDLKCFIILLLWGVPLNLPPRLKKTQCKGCYFRVYWKVFDLGSQHILVFCLFLAVIQQPTPDQTDAHVLTKTNKQTKHSDEMKQKVEKQAVNKCFSVFLTCIIQEDVFWLEVSVYNPVLVQMLKPTDDLSRVITSSSFIKAWILLIHIIHMESKAGSRSKG